MTCRAFFPVTLLALVLVAMALCGPYARAQQLVTTPPAAQTEQARQLNASLPPDELKGPYGLEFKDDDCVAGPRPAFVPTDPCLKPLYKNWYEFSSDARESDGANEFAAFRILLDRATIKLTFQGLRRDGATEILYESACGIGQNDSPTPEGKFFINHVYTYPDAAYFDESGQPHRGLYNGFFAPLLACDDDGLCKRFQDLGIHGFNPSAYPDPSAIRPQTCGAVSGGCVRLPDPCGFKATLIRVVGIGPAKKNDRGVYHWLNKPVKVVISGYYPGTDEFGTVVSLFEQGLVHVRDGLKGLFNGFGP